MFPYATPIKHKKAKSSDVFRGYKKRTLAGKRLKIPDFTCPACFGLQAEISFYLNFKIYFCLLFATH